MKFRLLLISILLLFTTLVISVFPQERKILVVAKVSSLPEKSMVYITGNTDELGNWYFMRKMIPEENNEWHFEISASKGDTLQFKFTRGDWSNEAVDSNGIEYPNFSHVVKNDTTLNYSLSYWRDQYDKEMIVSSERMKNKAGWLELFEGWKYKIGDDTSWADPDFDDSDWKPINPLLGKSDFEKLDWNGNIWFRNNLIIDSVLWNKPLSFELMNYGAAEVYLNGKLLYKYGEVGTSEENEIHYIERNPRVISFEPKKQQLMAVRFSNHNAKELLQYQVPAGFYIILGDLNGAISTRAENVRSFTIHQIGIGALILAFSIVHFLLFIFYPKGKENLFYSISMFLFSIIVYSGVRASITDSIFDAVLFSRINNIAVILAILFGLLTVYASTYKKIPRLAYVFFTIAAIFVIYISFTQTGGIEIINYAFYSFCVLMIIDIIRIMIVSIIKKDKWGWNWIVGMGFTVAMLIIIYQILISVQIIQQPLFGIHLVYIYGIIFLAVTVSINLSKKVADTNKDLEKQLIQVKELSQITIEQERKARDEEIFRKLLEADNERKTRELEEARALQLSMLPKKIPKLRNLDIAVYMKPASEVGGDYYDFKYESDEVLTVAVGDATGHGMKAGTIVATVKGLFSAEPIKSDFPSFFNRCNSIIKDMDLGNLFMSMIVAKIENNKMSFVSAGMPPILVYRNSENAVEELRFPGLPLGAAPQYHYAEKQTFIESGDTIFFMSDGFPELFNTNKEILDYYRAKNIFEKIGFKSSKEIIQDLCNEVDKWKDGADQQDDITFVVVKVK